MKRIFDVVVSLLALLVLFPIFLAVGVAVAVKLGSPVFFKQVRPGLYGEPFEILKFRTMTDARDENGALLPEDIRLTDFGKWLRSTSLDELPELINVLKGDMSLVGPRPLLMEYLPLYNDFQKQRMDVLPGITGWAQVNGRNAIVWDKKFEYDIWYVKNRSFFLDLKILFLTMTKVFKREGIGHENENIMPKFKGNKTD
ncbi:sugar transferase [Cecembia lonarensis]|uniref:Putative colanic biosynthesis UDP-glucose lipid carrier transferase n=1 Tax=Cecembia lonarensis (strain CCUG 58316 / KCTC 22772 / LW9) TaxID=1225176 RepID=K1L292_CECL9|nr:sugar transferase [Cecembia lonarensis]EKB48901.1 Putative colanic biosynthesis UDP-glucose lipid carrier transferase [Cecembia lonarensis LW9]